MLPPFVGLAVKVIFVPWQAAFVEALTLTDGVTVAFTTIVTVFEMALLFAAHAFVFEMAHEMVSPF